MLHDDELCGQLGKDGLPVCNACRLDYLRSRRRERKKLHAAEQNPHSDLSTVTTLGGVMGSVLAGIAMRSGLVFDTENRQWVKKN